MIIKTWSQALRKWIWDRVEDIRLQVYTCDCFCTDEEITNGRISAFVRQMEFIRSTADMIIKSVEAYIALRDDDFNFSYPERDDQWQLTPTPEWEQPSSSPDERTAPPAGGSMRSTEQTKDQPEGFYIPTPDTGI